MEIKISQRIFIFVILVVLTKNQFAKICKELGIFYVSLDIFDEYFDDFFGLFYATLFKVPKVSFWNADAELS